MFLYRVIQEDDEPDQVKMQPKIHFTKHFWFIFFRNNFLFQVRGLHS
jgi:hypothetical protein